MASEGNPDIASASRAETPDLFIDPVLEKKLLDQDKAVVYDLGRAEVQDTTAEYRAKLASRPINETAGLVDVGNPLFDHQLGPTWYANESGHRWMPQRATVTLRGPSGPREQLYVKGFCPSAALKPGPLKMQIAVDGEKLPPVSIGKPDAQFSFVFKLPPHFAGRSTVEISVELDRSFHVATDPRELGIVFGSFEIR